VKPRLGPWIRTAVAAAGLGFSAVSVGFACLDHVGEPVCEVPELGSGSGSAQVRATPGTGSGNGAVPAGDCVDAGNVGSGSGSALVRRSGGGGERGGSAR
jgi:hypothetical protein